MTVGELKKAISLLDESLPIIVENPNNDRRITICEDIVSISLADNDGEKYVRIEI
jgi:hypothetical protein